MKKYFKSLILFTIILTFLLTGCSSSIVTTDDEGTLKKSNVISSYEDDNNKGIANEEAKDDINKEMKVHFIDVGQADCILIESNNKFMLVDGGNNEDADRIVSYLQELGVKRLDYLIGTHPHADHIGSLDVVINKFDIGKVIMPPVSNNTKTFEDVLDAIEDKGLKITKPVVGTSYAIGDAEFIIIAPNKDYDSNLNNWSVGIKLINKDNTFILCGDAEAEAEYDIIANKIDIKADVLKANHHGSVTSNTSEFLDAVTPKYIVISSGEDNSYGHPHKEVLQEFKERGINLYRTDKQGTIVASSDGSNITWSTKPTSNFEAEKSKVESSSKVESTSKVENKEDADSKKASEKKVTYVLNTNTKKFHYDNCRSIANMSDKNKKLSEENRDKLIEEGYDACGICKP
ncbi:MAG: MBL fold metallo-hydrolase [Clostridiales bacterium]|nr:MBL fold metallo-hydrolase [Clostridiales bacterium]